VSVWAGTEGKLDDVPVGEIRRFESEFLEFLRHSYKGTLQSIADNNWDDEIVSTLDEAIAKFKQMFLAKEDKHLGKEAEAKALEGEENHETVTRYRNAPPEKQ
jgi:F-type H+-transporting ATPase subunit alpha